MTSSSPTFDIYKTVEEHVQPSEVIKIAARCKSVRSPNCDTLLAVISNVHNDHDAEQAALLAVEVRKNDQHTYLAGILPIFSDYTFTIEQCEDALSSDASTRTLELAGKPMQASFIVKFTSNNGQSSMSAITDEIAALGDLMQETKRLADVAAKHNYASNTLPPSHDWLRYYTLTSPEGQKKPYIIPRKVESFSALLSSYGSKALEGLPPSLSSTLGSFSFLGGALASAVSTGANNSTAAAGTSGSIGAPALPPKLPSRRNVQKVFEETLDMETRSQLEERKNEYMKVQNLKVHVATFNCNGQFYDVKQNLSSWLKPEEQPDILIVGLQEMDLRPEVLMVRHDTTIGHGWVSGILACLNDKMASSQKQDDDENNKSKQEKRKVYQCLEMKQLAGLYIAVFVDASLVRKGIVDEVTTTSVMTGWAGFAGNKGACGIRLVIRPHQGGHGDVRDEAEEDVAEEDQYRDGTKTLCFVVAHLAAFQDNVDRRNADYKDICTRMIFPPTSVPSSSSRNRTTQEGGLNSSSNLFYPTIFDCDTLFFFGDLNYRLDIPIDQLKSLLQQKEYAKLLEHDQLKKAQTHRLLPEAVLPGHTSSFLTAFEGFNEEEILFQPTYKYDKGTDQFDSSEKERKPAWTDRVLWWTAAAASASSRSTKAPEPAAMKLENTNSVESKDDSDSDQATVTEGDGNTSIIETSPPDDKLKIECKTYTSAMDVRMSDHKPVIAIFEVSIPVVDKQKQKQIVQELEKKV